MRIIKLGLAIAIAILLGSVSTQPALGCAGCQVCQEEGPCHEDLATGADVCPLIWVTGPGCGQTNGGCPSGAYMAPNGTCQAIGTGGGGGPTGPGCVNRSVDCAPGSTIALNQPLYSDCFQQWGGQYCSGPGTAQQVTGCCGNYHNEDGTPVCDDPQYTTYTCCAAGSQNQCSVTGSYTRTNSCWSPQICNNTNDTYVSNVADPALGVCGQGCSDYKPDGECRAGASFDLYNVRTTCNQVSCTCAATCSNTAPPAVIVTQGSSATVANVDWQTGTGGASQRLYIGTNLAAVNGGCIDTNNPCLSGYGPLSLELRLLL
jgi:hypothetical protein